MLKNLRQWPEAVFARVLMAYFFIGWPFATTVHSSSAVLDSGEIIQQLLLGICGREGIGFLMPEAQELTLDDASGMIRCKASPREAKWVPPEAYMSHQ